MIVKGLDFRIFATVSGNSTLFLKLLMPDPTKRRTILLSLILNNKAMKKILLLLTAMFVATSALTSCSNSNKDAESTEGAQKSTNDADMIVVIYNDDTGEIRDGNGNRLGGFSVYGGRNNPNLYLKSEIDFFGVSTDQIYLHGGYAYAEFSDALDGNYENGISYTKKEEGTELHYLLKNTEGKKLSKKEDGNDYSNSSTNHKPSSEEAPQPETSSTKQKGWSFLLKHLKSPSTASLVGYADPSAPPCQELANDLKLPGLGVAMYQVDAQNGYGAMIRQNFLVFFKNGEPVKCDEAETIAKQSAQLVRSWLSLNGW